MNTDHPSSQRATGIVGSHAPARGGTTAELGAAMVEGLFVAGLIILISAMAVETRCLFESLETAQTDARNQGIAAAMFDTGPLRLERFEVQPSTTAFSVLTPLMERAGLDHLRLTYDIFVGTEAGE